MIDSRNWIRPAWMVLAVCGAMASPGHAAPAPAAAVDVPIKGTGAETPIRVHKGRITAFYLPERVVHVLNSNADDYAVQFKGDRVVLRPLKDPAPAANMIIRTAHHVVSVLLMPAASSDEAVSHVVFVEAAAPAPQAPSRLSLRLQGVFGRATAGDPAAMGQTDLSILAGAAAQLAYRGSAYHAYELTLTLAHGSPLHFENIAGTPPRADDPADSLMGQMARSMLLGRVQAGVSLRYGARVVPSLRIAVGPQGRALLAARIHAYQENFVMAGPDDTLVWDWVVSGGVGLDLRRQSGWQIGARVTTTRLLSSGPMFESLEGAVYVHW